MSTSPNSKELFASLVNNAVDFLERSVEELSSHPKFSVIHFYAAVELFLKARLVAEHWSLVVAGRGAPDRRKFIEGDFRSVSLDEAVERLDKTLGESMAGDYVAVFREVAKHRNKMVHFFHEAVDEQGDKRLREHVVREHLRAWHRLHRLVTLDWFPIFWDVEEVIREIDKKLRELHQFLTVVFEDLKPEIEARISGGEHVEECPACSFQSYICEEDYGVIADARCLVCEFSNRTLLLECPGCSADLRLESEGFATCVNCSRKLEPDDVISALVDEHGHSAPGDPPEGSDFANCSECDGYHTVINTPDGRYVCCQCFTEYEILHQCDWCSELNTREYDYLSGCNHCDGRAGWDRD